MIEPAIIIHGGAGKLPQNIEKSKLGVIEATKIGWSFLEKEGKNAAIDAVENAVKSLEDNKIFNAGTGSVLALDGKIYMDASIMRGSDQRAGAVCSIQNVRHPISLARHIMEETDHVLISGVHAENLAKIWKLEFLNDKMITQERKKKWEKTQKKYLNLKESLGNYLKINSELLAKYPNFKNEFGGTVGAVAIDQNGNLAVATSTGGTFLKLPGRVGDTPIIGAGTYVSDNAGGVSATGVGEVGIELAIGKTVVNFMKKGDSAQDSVEKSIDLIKKFKNVPFGLIAIDKNGNIGLAHSSEALVFASKNTDSNFIAGVTGKDRI
ncbi:MAG: isoaspartyl peptidase/L-asparaginase family protein [Candidatus Ranarchaeia archaeon]